MARARFLFVRGLLFASFALASLPVLALPPGVDNSDPLVAIDRHRESIISDIVQGFQGEIAKASPGKEREGAVVLRERLSRLRADRLLAASLTSSYASLNTILDESDAIKESAFAGARQKALGDANRDLVYAPLTPCRLIDTRGFGAPIQGGAFTPNQRRAYAPGGQCSIPLSGVATLLISFTTQNLTPNSGGYLAILAPNAPVTASVDVFNLGAEWSASNTAVATGSAGQFDVLVAAANAHVVLDILGYFSPATIAAGGIGTQQIADGAVTYSKLAAGSLPSAIITINGGTGTIQPFTAAKYATPPCPTGTLALFGSCSSTGLVVSVTGFGPSANNTFSCGFTNPGNTAETVTLVAYCLPPVALAK